MYEASEIRTKAATAAQTPWNDFLFLSAESGGGADEPVDALQLTDHELATRLSILADWILADLNRRAVTVDLVHAHKLSIEALAGQKFADRLIAPNRSAWRWPRRCRSRSTSVWVPPWARPSTP